MATLQQQKDVINIETQRLKDEADNLATTARQNAADEESKRIQSVADEEIKQVQYDAQR